MLRHIVLSALIACVLCFAAGNVSAQPPKPDLRVIWAWGDRGLPIFHAYLNGLFRVTSSPQQHTKSQFLRVGDAIEDTPYLIVGFRSVIRQEGGHREDRSELIVQHEKSRQNAHVVLWPHIDPPGPAARLIDLSTGEEKTVLGSFSFAGMEFGLLRVHGDEVVLKNAAGDEVRVPRISVQSEGKQIASP